MEELRLLLSTETPKVFNGEDFLSVAKALMHQTDEASLRTCIGRSYYAVFLVARGYATKYDGLNLRDRLAHKGVWDHFNPRNPRNQPTPPREYCNIYRSATRLQEAREQADYMPAEDVNWRENSKSWLTTAEGLLDTLRHLERKAKERQHK